MIRSCSTGSAAGSAKKLMTVWLLRLAAFVHLLADDRGGETDLQILVVRHALAGRRQRSDVPGEQRHRLVDRECADHEEREVGRVREAVAVEAQHLAGVERGKRLRRQRPRRVVVRGVDLLQPLAEHLAGTLSAIGDRGLELPLHELKGVRVVVGSGEDQVEQLQRRFEIGRRRRAVDALSRMREERRRGADLARQHLAEIERLDSAVAGEADVARRRTTR